MKKLPRILLLFLMAISPFVYADIPTNCPSVSSGHVGKIRYSFTGADWSQYFPFFTITEDSTQTWMSLARAAGNNTSPGRQMFLLLMLAKSDNFPITVVCAGGDVNAMSVRTD